MKGWIKMISVAMASYNGEKYIKKQIQSILDNLNQDDEVVISDDGSTDSTLKIIAGLNDSRIKLIAGPHNGINKNFENAIKHCKGDYIFLSDQDDIWYPNKVCIVMKYFKNNPSCVLIQHDAKVTDGEGNILIHSFSKHRKVRNGIIKNLMRNTYHGCLMAFKSKLRDYIIPIPRKGCFHDQWIGLMANGKGDCLFIEETLMEYRRYENNASNFTGNPIHIQLKNRIITFMNLLLYYFGANYRI